MLAVDAAKSSQNFPEFAPSHAYTHGLEQIYALKTVDPSTVKRISIPSQTVKESSVSLASKENDALWDGQLMFMLGEEFQYWISPLFLEEPIQVLLLSQRTEIVCLDLGIQRVKDLLGQDFHDWLVNKRIGQGYVEEIRQKLKEFIRGRSEERAFSIGLVSLLRSLTVGLERKKVAALLESYDLAEFYPLSPLEKMESLNLNSQKRLDWINDAKKELLQEEIRSNIREKLDRLSKVFIIPWMRARGGVVNIYEILERLERVAEEPQIVSRLVRFLQEVCLSGQHPFTLSLVEVAEGIFCPDRFAAECYQKICKLALTYFYRDNAAYEFCCLKTLLAEEFGSNWEGFPDLFVTRTLKRSPLFRVRKGKSGDLEVRLSQCPTS